MLTQVPEAASSLPQLPSDPPWDPPEGSANPQGGARLNDAEVRMLSTFLFLFSLFILVVYAAADSAINLACMTTAATCTSDGVIVFVGDWRCFRSRTSLPVTM